MMSTKAIVLLIVAVGVVGAFAISNPAPPTSEPTRPVMLAGKTWHGSLDEALVIARRENKPVLHLQMFGKLDDALC
jgi:hypothetical protein